MQALDESIADWNSRAAGENLDKPCALCAAFRQPGCDGCPVHEVTKSSCRGTPFFAYKAARSQAERMATAELQTEFLRALRSGDFELAGTYLLRE